ncbi:unnamed protein product [Diatraea saccharalis]|uniref:BTB domain-containing protein n=1 Tax=Diatraea saccharalis TaxID=40085 RepID=A0A9N9W719_9NEOP|nr:unnamed protein product [Diatraea saccharalis]
MSCPSPETDWQLSCMKLKQRGSHLLQSGEWSDCSFLVGSDLNRYIIKAHKLILASASPVFKAMFFGTMAEKDGPIEILDVEPEAFETLLKYIYTDKTSIKTFEKACSVYYSAKKYMLPYLEKECSLFISLHLNPQNVCRAYELAQLFEETVLMDTCVKILTDRTTEIINNKSFMEAELGTLLTLVSQESLNIDSELVLFHAIEKYANINTSRKRSLDSNTLTKTPKKKAKKSIDVGDTLALMFEVSKRLERIDSENNANAYQNTPAKAQEDQEDPVDYVKDKQKNVCDSNNNETESSCSFENSNSGDNCVHMLPSIAACASGLRKAVCNIRFLTLTAQQFAGGPARSPLLTESEAFAVLMNILSSQAPVPMPHGFSTCRVPRNQLFFPQEQESNCKSEVMFKFTVLNFKTRRRSVESLPFNFLDMSWSIKLVPRFEVDTSGNEHKYYGLFLKCTGPWSRDSGSGSGGGAGTGSEISSRSELSASAGSGSGTSAGSGSAPWSVSVQARLQLVPYDTSHAPISADICRTFSSSKDYEWGFHRFVTWTVLMKPDCGFVRGNSIAIEARLVEQ